MGKWKYINWLIVLIILAHMYHYISHRYDGTATAYVLSTIGWLLMTILGYYVFVFRINNHGGNHRNPTPEKVVPKAPVRERPKVNFKKKDQI